MASRVYHHFEDGLTPRGEYLDDDGDFACVRIDHGETFNGPTLFFYSVDDIAKLASALFRLGRDYAAKLQSRTYTDAVLSGFGCSPEAIAKAEADAEAADINRLTGRDPHECVRCRQIDCVCTKPIDATAIHAAREAAAIDSGES